MCNHASFTLPFPITAHSLFQSRYCGVMMLEPFWSKLDLSLVYVRSNPIEWTSPHVDVSCWLVPDRLVH